MARKKQRKIKGSSYGSMEELLPPFQPPNSGATAAGNAPGNGQGAYAPPDEMQMMPENIDPYQSGQPGDVLMKTPQIGSWLPYTQEWMPEDISGTGLMSSIPSVRPGGVHHAQVYPDSPYMKSKSGRYNNNVAHSGMIRTDGPESLGLVQNEQGEWVKVSAISPDGTPSAPQSWAQGARNYIVGQQEAKQEWMNREGISPQEADALEAQMMEQGGGVQDLAKLYASSRTGQIGPPQTWAQGAQEFKRRAGASYEDDIYNNTAPPIEQKTPVETVPSFAEQVGQSQRSAAIGPGYGSYEDIEGTQGPQNIPAWQRSSQPPDTIAQQAAEATRAGTSYEQDMHEGTPTPVGQDRLTGMPQKSLAEMAKERQTAVGPGQSTTETGDTVAPPTGSGFLGSIAGKIGSITGVTDERQNLFGIPFDKDPAGGHKGSITHGGRDTGVEKIEEARELEQMMGGAGGSVYGGVPGLDSGSPLERDPESQYLYPSGEYGAEPPRQAFQTAYQALKERKGGVDPSAAETANLYKQFIAPEGGPDIMGGINVDRTVEAIEAGKEALTQNPVADKVEQIVMGLPTSDGGDLDTVEGSGFGNYGGRGIDHDKAAAEAAAKEAAADDRAGLYMGDENNVTEDGREIITTESGEKILGPHSDPQSSTASRVGGEGTRNAGYSPQNTMNSVSNMSRILVGDLTNRANRDELMRNMSVTMPDGYTWDSETKKLEFTGGAINIPGEEPVPADESLKRSSLEEEAQLRAALELKDIAMDSLRKYAATDADLAAQIGFMEAQSAQETADFEKRREITTIKGPAGEAARNKVTEDATAYTTSINNAFKAIGSGAENAYADAHTALSAPLPPAPSGLGWDSATGTMEFREGFEGREMDEATRKWVAAVTPAFKARDRLEIAVREGIRLEQEFQDNQREIQEADERFNMHMATAQIDSAEEAAAKLKMAEQKAIEFGQQKEYLELLMGIMQSPVQMGMAKRYGLLDQITTKMGFNIPEGLIPTAPSGEAALGTPNYNDWVTMDKEQQAMAIASYVEAGGNQEEFYNMIGKSRPIAGMHESSQPTQYGVL